MGAGWRRVRNADLRIQGIVPGVLQKAVLQRAFPLQRLWSATPATISCCCIVRSLCRWDRFRPRGCANCAHLVRMVHQEVQEFLRILLLLLGVRRGGEGR